MIHDLKTWPAPFQAMREGQKTFEFRRADRAFEIGDLLVLREYDPEDERYTGEMIERRVTYILQGGQFGVPEGFVCMSVAIT